MRVFTATLSLIIFGFVFLICFAVSYFIVGAGRDFLLPYSVGLDARFANELNILPTALLTIGCIILGCAVVTYFIEVSVEEPDEYFRNQ